jgi:hypothetical protein
MGSDGSGPPRQIMPDERGPEDREGDVAVSKKALAHEERKLCFRAC